MRPDFDRVGFSRHVQAWLEQRGLSYRAAASAYPLLNPAMLSRACNEQPLSIASMLALCRVIDLDPMRYLLLPDQQKQAVTAFDTREAQPERGHGR